MKVFVHQRAVDHHEWVTNSIVDFETIPSVGEYFTLELSGTVFECLLVLHTPQSKHFSLEIFCKPVDFTDVVSHL